MSRIADAMARATGVSADDPFRADDHPWGDALGEASTATPGAPSPDVMEPVPSLGGLGSKREQTRRVQPGAAPLRRTPDVTSTVDPSLRPHLAALVERVFFPVSGEPLRSVAFTGLDAQSARITTAAAEMLAHHTGANVCLVDANVTTPSLHTYFGIENGPGLADAIADAGSLSDVAQIVGPNLWLVPAGTGGRRTSFASDSVRLRMAQFIARFDYVLLDIEPVSADGDATGLAPLLGGVILVLSADATRRESARRAAQVLQSSGAAVIGAVLTDRRFPIPDSLYRRL